MRKKVTVIGAGNVGATCALYLADKELCDVVVVDIVEGVPQGKGLDILEACPVGGQDVKVIGTNDYAETANSDIIIQTAGFPRKPGMSRDDLLMKNYEIVKSCIEQAAKYSPNAIIIVVANPLDAMCHVALAASGFSKNRVIGMAGVLDTARFRTFLAEACDVSVENVTAFVLGGHGDTMVPLVRYTSVAGIPITDLLDAETLEKIVDRARKGGAEIVALLKTGSAFYAPATSAISMAEAYLYDQKRILPCAVEVNGKYGVDGLYVGVPVVIGAGGAEEVIEISLTDEEKANLGVSVDAVKELLEACKALDSSLA